MVFVVLLITMVSMFLLGLLPQSNGQECPVGMQSLGNGAPCLNDYGCSLQANGYRCYSGTCCIVSDIGNIVTPVCRAPNEVAEMENGRPKNCLYTSCSIGYTCEFSYAVNGGQYLCCGKPS